MKRDYILSSQLLGASRFHIMKKHLRVLLLGPLICIIYGTYRPNTHTRYPFSVA